MVLRDTRRPGSDGTIAVITVLICSPLDGELVQRITDHRPDKVPSHP